MATLEGGAYDDALFGSRFDDFIRAHGVMISSTEAMGTTSSSATMVTTCCSAATETTPCSAAKAPTFSMAKMATISWSADRVTT